MQCCSRPQAARLAPAGGQQQQQQQRRVRAFPARSFSASSSSSSSSSSSGCALSAGSSRQPSAACRQQQSLSLSRPGRQLAVACRAADNRPPAGSSSSGVAKFNPVYLVITGAYAGLLVFKNPYIYAVLTILTILPQNSNVTSLNNLVLLFYESGLFQNFAEAVNCVRLVTWLSMGFMVASFAVFK